MHTRMQIPPTSAALIPLPNPTLGDPEQEVMLKGDHGYLKGMLHGGAGRGWQSGKQEE